MTAWPELGFRVSMFPLRMVLITSFSSFASSFASWVLLLGWSVSSSSVSERLLVESKRSSSRVWLLRSGEGSEWRLFGWPIWRRPIRAWRRRLSKLGVLLNELMVDWN